MFVTYPALPCPADADLDAPDRASGDAAYYRTALHALIDMGVEMAGLLTMQAGGDAAAGDGAALAAAAVALERVSRGVRRTVLLARRVAEPETADASVAGRVAQRAAQRARIIRVVEDTIDREADAGDADALEAELRERLDTPELEEQLGQRPTDEIIAEICRDLGVMLEPAARLGKRRTPADVAVMRVRAASPAGAAVQPARDEWVAPRTEWEIAEAAASAERLRWPPRAASPPG